MIRLALPFAAAVLSAAIVVAPGPAAAQAADQSAAAFRAVIDCKRLSDNVARLACYDSAAGQIAEATARGDMVVIDRAQAAAAHRQAFGLALPSLDFMTRALRPEDAGRVEGVINAVSADPSGRWTMSLEDGAVWRQIDGQVFKPPHRGSKVGIRKGALGSFLMNIDGQPAVKVHRDR